MSDFRRVKAGARISLISGAFWALAGGLIGTALSIPQIVTGTATLATTALGVLVLAGMTGIVGMMGGAFYSSVLAVRAGGSDASTLSPVRAIFAGAVGGIAVHLALRFLILPLFILDPPAATFIGTLVSLGFFGGLGAATGAAILGTAKRAPLPGASDDLDRIDA